MKNKSIGILGGSGFVGQCLCARLIQCGYDVHVICRDPNRHPKLKVLPGLNITRGNIFDNQVLADFCHNKNVIINLVGILNEPKDDGSTFQHVHIDLAHRVVMACETANVPRLLHMSALHADANKGNSRYLRSKGEAEDWAHHASEWGLKVTSFRPSVIFGKDDRFLNLFASLLKLSPLIFPLACANSRFAPVYVGDVAQAFINALTDDNSIGNRYELCGPQIYTLKQLVQYTAQLIDARRKIMPLPDFAARMQARVLGLLPTKPFTMDNYRSLQTDSVCTHNGFEELGIQPQSLENIAPQYLAQQTVKGRFDEFRKQHPFKVPGSDS